jgi:hypothetical protein
MIWSTQSVSPSVSRKSYHCVLLVLDRLDCDLGQEVIMQKMRRKVRFDRETFRKELLVEVLSSLLTHQHTSTPLVL